ncbi:MAG TPA: hypothetical protein VJB34_06600 [Bdellovibrionota bacterium]|nr:hypothetical protein [Bdellovibrionota bacterium]
MKKVNMVFGILGMSLFSIMWINPALSGLRPIRSALPGLRPIGPVLDMNAAERKKKLIVNVQCQGGMAGGESTEISGQIKLNLQKQGFYIGKGTLSVKISEARKGTILEEKDVSIKAYFDDLIVATVRAAPDPKKEKDSKISSFIFIQQNGDEDDPLPSEVVTKDKVTHMTLCDLEY